MQVLGKPIKKLLLSILLFGISLPVFAIPFTNGDFSAGNAGWSGAASNTGTVSFDSVAEVAQLETGIGDGFFGDDPYSAILVQGDDGFFSFSPSISLALDVAFLEFDALFNNLGNDSSESIQTSNSDFLSVVIYDANFPNEEIFANEGIDNSLMGWTSFSLDVSAWQGADIALSFELNDLANGFDSQVLLDNIKFKAAVVSVPEPNSIALFGLGLLLFGFTLRIDRLS